MPDRLPVLSFPANASSQAASSAVRHACSASQHAPESATEPTAEAKDHSKSPRHFVLAATAALLGIHPPNHAPEKSK